MNPKRYTVSRAKRYKMGELIREGKTLIEAESIVFAGDQNRSRNTEKWRERGLYPYGTLDSPNDETINYFPELESVIMGQDMKTTKTEPAKQNNLKENTFDEYLQSLSAEDVLRLAVSKFGIDPDISPRLKRSAKESMTLTVRLPKELVKRVKEKLSAEGISMSRVIEQALFQYIGSPEDMIDKGKTTKIQIRHYLKLIEKAGISSK